MAAPTVVKEPEPAAVVECAAAEGAEGAEPNAAGDASAKTPEDNKTKAPAEIKRNNKCSFLLDWEILIQNIKTIDITSAS